MALLRIDEPDVEPVGLEDAKQHLRLDTDDDDTLVSGLIVSARTHLEQLLGRALITQTWIEVRDAWPTKNTTVQLPLAPVQDVSDVRVIDNSGIADSLPADFYFLDRVSAPARLCPIAATAWPKPERSMNGIEIELVAGFGDHPDHVPSPIRQAILLLVAHWYEQREPVSVGAAIAHVPQTVAGLLVPYRARWLS